MFPVYLCRAIEHNIVKVGFYSIGACGSTFWNIFKHYRQVIWYIFIHFKQVKNIVPQKALADQYEKKYTKMDFLFNLYL